ncbi:hypothetical protein BDV12DRAFT_209431 [Aspergillus spectabilis]
MSSDTSATLDPFADNAHFRRAYDPTTQGSSGDFMNKFTVPISGFEDPNIGHSYAVVRLTAKGDGSLFDLCHNSVQKEVWRFPSYEFVVRVGALSVKQVRTGQPSYVNAILTASRGLRTLEPSVRNSRRVFGEHVRIPGYWNGACAGCKCRDGGASCDFFAVSEPKYMPNNMEAVPRAPIEINSQNTKTSSWCMNARSCHRILARGALPGPV